MADMTEARTVAITGAVGNLGIKLIEHLLTHTQTPRIIGLDVQPPQAERLAALHTLAAARPHPTALDFVACDLADAHDSRWQQAIEDVEAVVHFAAQNPYPEATWAEAGVSLDMTLNVALAAAQSPRTERFVFATSNHVMGRYKDVPWAESVGVGELRPDSPPGVGTVWHTGTQMMDSTAYATAKFSGERVCRALAAQGNGSTSFVCVRIGWCQPGPNRPETLSATGSPTLSGGTLPTDVDPIDFARSDRWFREMWLSNRDFAHLFERTINASAERWPSPYLLVNGMSANRGMKWSLAETRQFLGYHPQDDVYAV